MLDVELDRGRAPENAHAHLYPVFVEIELFDRADNAVIIAADEHERLAM